MTREETAQILAVIETTYPNYKPRDRALAINLWNSILGAYDYHAVLTAVEMYIATDEQGFAPVPGQINGVLNRMKQTGTMTDMEAWSIVYKAICNSAWHAEEEFDKLPADIQRGVGTAGQLHAWAIDASFNEGVAMSQFIKSYRAVRERREELDRLPANIRGQIESTAAKLEG